MKAKIYKITNKITNKIYIGSTTICETNDRWSHHKYKLNNKLHPNPHLQNAWNKYGADNFKFEYVHECEINNKNDVFFIEQEWIEITCCCNPKIGYNINKQADAPPLNSKHFKLKDPNGIIHEGVNLSQFCRDQNLDHTYRNGFNCIINGYNNQKTYKGWSLPDFKQDIRQIRDPSGIIHDIKWNKMNAFCKIHKLLPSEVCFLLKGKSICHKGWTHPNTKYQDISNKCRTKKLIKWRD